METPFIPLHPMIHLRILNSILLVAILALPIGAFARPSFRTIRNEGTEQLNAEKQAKRQYLGDVHKTQYKRRDHPRGGMSAEIPKDWELYIPGKYWTL
ncbi:MAG: hypothetical protein Greene101449_938 [Candidatus Peregrinibacteria bacterium Greene1014_49]|nr:MAG: hypothetical protein Greene101449_938 [Candidatus Peregrinibacteria bacterium Greene1014_49]